MTPIFRRYKRTAAGRRSGFEDRLMQQMKLGEIEALYEPFFIRFQHRAPRRYTPDIVLPNGILIEAKGYFEAQDRTKHLLIRQEHPELDIRFVFERSKTRLSNTSKQSYADWCVRNGFMYADKTIPASWLEEPSKHDRQVALERLAVPIKRTRKIEKE